jgi:hypothetical protein
MARQARGVHPVKRRPLPPHRLQILGKTWKIRYGDPSGETLTSKEHGACVFAERTIYLSTTLRLKENDDDLWDTVGHELLHAADEASGTGKALTHVQIFRLEAAIGSILRFLCSRD